MFKYTPLYANGKEPVIEEQDVYRIEIPYIPTLQGSTFDTTQKSIQKILDLIRENPYVTTQEMADSIGIIRRTIAKHIKSLQEKGIIKHIGPDKGGIGRWENDSNASKFYLFVSCSIQWKATQDGYRLPVREGVVDWHYWPQG